MGRGSRAARRSPPPVPPKPVKIEELLFFKLKAALTQRLLMQQRARQAMAEADAAVAKLLTEAGVDPNGAYELDEKKLTITRLQ